MTHSTFMFIFGYSQVLLAAAWHCLPICVDPIRDGEDLSRGWILNRDCSLAIAVVMCAAMAIRVLSDC